MDLEMRCTRFSVYDGHYCLGVVVPRNDGWVFVMRDPPFRFFVGDTPEAAVAASQREEVKR